MEEDNGADEKTENPPITMSQSECYATTREFKKCLLDFSDRQDMDDTMCMSYLQKVPVSIIQFSVWRNAETKLPDPIPEGTKRKTERTSKVREKWKEWKPNEINFSFSHSVDYKEHIKQYRQEYTYKTRTYNKNTTTGQYKVNGNTEYYSPQTRPSKPPVFTAIRQTGKMKYEHRQNSPKQLTYSSMRAQSEPDILDLQHRYKIDPGAIKKALIANLGEIPNGVSDPAKPADYHDPLDDVKGFWKNPVRTTSAKSVKETIHSRSSGTVNLTPTSAARHGTVPHLPNGATTPLVLTSRDKPASRPSSNRPPLEPITIQPLVTSSTQSMPPVLLSNVTDQKGLLMDPQTMLVIN